MTFLEIVKQAMKRAMVREDSPSTVTGATGIVEDFVGFVGDTYKSIQRNGHAESWFFRQSLGETLTMVVGQEEYSIPTHLKDINYRTVTCYLTTPKVEETPVYYKEYYDWRQNVNNRDYEDGKPQHITPTPEGKVVVTPAPDQAYTLHFDGVLAIDEMTLDADEPIIPEDWHDVLVWGAVRRFAKRHEDGSLLADADEEYQPIYDSLVNHQLPDVRVQTGHLYSTNKTSYRTGRR